MQKSRTGSFVLALLIGACQTNPTQDSTSSSAPTAPTTDATTARETRKTFALLGDYELIGPTVSRFVDSVVFQGPERWDGAFGRISNATGGDIVAVRVTLRAWDLSNETASRDFTRAPSARRIRVGKHSGAPVATKDGASVLLDGFVLGPQHSLELSVDDIEPGDADAVAIEVEPIFARAR